MLLVLPSDHFIPDSHAFTSMVEQAERLADKGQIVTFGVVPDRPETGYGYIEEGEKGKVLAFHEKPDHGRAAEMLQSGRFLWNAGIFLGLADSFISGADSFVPEMNAPVKKAVDKAEKDLDFLRLDRENWAEITPLSVDYALMEKADNLSVVPFSGTWSDLGDWQAIKRAVSTQKTDSNRAGQDSDGNILKGKAVQTGTTNSLIWAEEGGPVVAVAGLDNIIAVAMADAVLIADTKKAQSVKDLIESLKDKDISQAQTHARDYRPWGWFESLVLAPFYQVKRLHVYACSSLSLQSHKFRSEHWVVTDGTATVQIEDEVFDLQANQSVYIEAGQKHRLSNKTDAPVTLIEVQTGSYLGEDDIIRYEDQYKRV